MVMKKTFLALALLGSGAIAMAQDSVGVDYNTRTTLQSSTGNYNAYSVTTNVPASTRNFLTRDYPTAANPTWEQAGDWYRATYLDNNRAMHVYYSPNGSSYLVALPVLQSWIPDNVITSALNLYGNNIYSVNKIRAANGNDVYQVNILENGMTRTEYIGLDGQPVNTTDIFLVPGIDMNQMNSDTSHRNNGQMNNQMNNNMDHNMMQNGTDNNNMNGTDPNVKKKTKVKHTNGHEIKTKTKNGKTRVKESDPAIKTDQ
jgi:hypothetical protein